jgi:putative hydrolase of the HAD superfamily
MQNLKAVAFDLDGTLYPGYRINFRLVPFAIAHLRLLIAFGRAREIIRKEQENAPDISLSQFYAYQAQVVGRLLNAPAQEIQEKLDRFIYKGWEPHFKHVRLYSNVKKTLEALRKSGLKLALLSDFPPENKIKYLNLDGLWDTILCSESTGKIKPHPKSFCETALALGVRPEETLYVGNSHSVDILGAASAGMKTAWIRLKLPSAAERVLPGPKRHPKPDFTFSDYRQLYDFMLH